MISEETNKIRLYDLLLILNNIYINMENDLYENNLLEKYLNNNIQLINKILNNLRYFVSFSVVDDEITVKIRTIANKTIVNTSTIYKKVGSNEITYTDDSVIVNNYNNIVKYISMIDEYYYLFSKNNSFTADSGRYRIEISFNTLFGVISKIYLKSNRNEKISFLSNGILSSKRAGYRDEILQNTFVDISALPELFAKSVIDEKNKEKIKQKVK